MSEQNMTSEIVSLRNENAVLREELVMKMLFSGKNSHWQINSLNGSESRYSDARQNRLSL